MPVLISMLRGVNVGGHNKIKMDALRSLYESLKFTGCQTYVQSGNLVFATRERDSDLNCLAARLQSAIARKFGFSPDVILRTSAELRAAVAKNPFAKHAGLDSSKLLVAFLASDPGVQARANLSTIKIAPEEAISAGRELYIYFPNGIGRAKLSWPAIERALKVPFTGRNWNTVTRLLEMAEKLEAAQ
jgi:uncharacterized protein (DUF1697 family)